MASLKEIIDYISLDSKEAAKYVKLAIRRKVSSLSFFPDKFSREYLLKDSNYNYRSVSKWAYKIIYKVDLDSVYIILVVGTHQSPQTIKRKLKG